jgi:hypothetical protein
MPHPRLARSQQVDLRRANRQNTAPEVPLKPSMFTFVIQKPLGQQRLEPFGTGLLGHLSDPPQHPFHLALVFGWKPFTHAGVSSPAGFRPQQLDGVFAALAPLFAEFVNEERAPLPTTPQVALTQARQQFFGNLSAHRHPSRLVTVTPSAPRQTGRTCRTVGAYDYAPFGRELPDGPAGTRGGIAREARRVAGGV